MNTGYQEPERVTSETHPQLFACQNFPKPPPLPETKTPIAEKADSIHKIFADLQNRFEIIERNNEAIKIHSKSIVEMIWAKHFGQDVFQLAKDELVRELGL